MACAMDMDDLLWVSGTEQRLARSVPVHGRARATVSWRRGPRLDPPAAPRPFDPASVRS